MTYNEEMDRKNNQTICRIRDERIDMTPPANYTDENRISDLDCN
uniref:Uncharacterized protein n=1 Tax=Nelumbo nucifera TaxID=4432 RepID=A0A822XSM2_NELNU|nr:TPA_asm: hypothetical protein HUJ06_024476 [Nelumbo nucifera]